MSDRRISALFCALGALLLVLSAPAFRTSPPDELRLVRLEPPDGEVDGVDRGAGRWPPSLDGDNSVKATLEYELASSDEAELGLTIRPPHRLFREGSPVDGGEGRLSFRFTVVCREASPPERRVRRLTFSLDQVDSSGNWVRSLAVVERGVDFRFLCPEQKEAQEME